MTEEFITCLVSGAKNGDENAALGLRAILHAASKTAPTSAIIEISEFLLEIYKRDKSAELQRN